MTHTQEPPKVIWATPTEEAGWLYAGATNLPDRPHDGCHRYHHDAVVQKLMKALEQIAEGRVDWAHKPADEMRDIASAALAATRTDAPPGAAG